MALFTDANVVSLDDLLEFENSLVQVSSTYNIDVTTKINLAIGAVGDRLMLWLLQVGAADPQWFTRRVIGLSTVVVTSTLHRWLCFDSLSRFFAEAYNAQLNTRYQGKWTEYEQLASEAADMVFMSGLGVVYAPLPEPGMPFASVQTGTLLQALFVQTAWVDARGNESALSPVNGLVLSQPSSVSVAVGAGTVVPPPAAIGWNVYGSTTANNLTRQNATPLPAAASWQLPASGLISGPVPLNGQQPDFYVLLSRQIQRG